MIGEIVNETASKYIHTIELSTGKKCTDQTITKKILNDVNGCTEV